MSKNIVIASGKGGVGKTSVAVGIARALALCGKKVLIIDCDMLRSVDMVVNVSEGLLYDWGDVLNGACGIEQAIYRSGDIYIMTCPQSYSGVSVKKLKALKLLLAKRFDYILLDAPAGVDTGFIVCCVLADMAIVVSTPDSVCVRAAFTACERLEKYGVSNSRLIINRVVKRDIKKGRFLNFDDVIDKAQIRLLGAVPEDREIRYSSMDGKKLFKRGNKSYKAFLNIAARLEGENVPLGM